MLTISNEQLPIQSLSYQTTTQARLAAVQVEDATINDQVHDVKNLAITGKAAAKDFV
jgi:hypothetical protein